MVSPYLKRRLRSIEEVEQAQAERRVAPPPIDQQEERKFREAIRKERRIARGGPGR